MNENLDEDGAPRVVASVTLFEKMEGGRGKFCTIQGVFEEFEPLGEVLKFADEEATERKQTVIKIELGRDERKE